MGFNFGAFAGGAAQGYTTTAKTMSDIEAQKKRDALVELQTKEAEQAMTGREALRSAIAEQGGEKTYTPNFSGTGGMDSNDVAPTPVTQTPTERMSRSTERAIQLGADPMAVMQYKNAARQDINADSAQKVFDWMQGSNKAVAEKGLVAAAEEYLIPQYNSNKGLMNDGMTAKVVNTKVGPIVQFADGQGNIQHNMTKPLTIKTFGEARDLVGSSMLMASGPEHYYKGQELGIKQSELGLKGKELDAKIPLYKAQAGLAAAHTGVYSNMLETAKTNKAAGEAMKPFLDEFAALSEEDQVGAKGQAVLLKGATAGASKSKDLAGVVSMLRKPDRAAVSAEQEKAAYAAYNEASTPEQIKAVKAKYPDVFGKSALDKAIEARAKSGKTEAAAKVEPPATAIPTEQKFIRSKTPRGAFVYTPSPRGQTKAQWEALDAERSSASE